MTLLQKNVLDRRSWTTHQELRIAIRDLDCADDQGRGEQVRNWFRRPGYVPESLFYLFAGRPDQILISSMEERVAALWPHSDSPGT